MTNEAYLLHLVAQRFGADEKLCERLVYWQPAPNLSWAVRRLVDSKHVAYRDLVVLSEACDIPIERLVYAYYQFKEKTLSEVKKTGGYYIVRKEIERAYNLPDFWNSILPYNYKCAERLAVELMIERGVRKADILFDIPISESKLSVISRDFLARYINEKGHDTERI